MAHTMFDELALTQDPKVALVYRGILEPGEVLDKLPVETVNTLEVKNLRWKSLPTVNFAFVGEAYTEGVGKVEPVSYGLAVIGHDIDIPRLFDKEVGNHILDPKALGVEMTTKAIAYKITSTLFNGDKAADARAFDGFKRISTALPGRQTIDASSAALYGGDGTSLDIRLGGASTAIRMGLLDALNRAKRVTEDSKPDLMVCNENFYDLFESVLRREKLFDTTQDQFGREVMSYRRIPFVDAGYADVDGAALILANDHDIPAAVTPTTSVYFMRLDAKRHIGLLQTKQIEVRPIGELEAKPMDRYRVDWTLGVPVWGKRSLVRVKNIRVG